MKNRKWKVAVIVAAIAIVAVFTTALAAQIWHHDLDDGTKVTRVDLEGDGDFQAMGFDAEAYFGGSAEWYRDCEPVTGAYSPRVHVKRKANGDVQVICIEAIMTPTPAPTQDPNG